MKTSALDAKKRRDAIRAEHLFRTRRISVEGLDDQTLHHIHGFPLPVQRLIADEAMAVMERLAKGKAPPGMIELDCHCRFFTRYLVPCRHMFHEHIYGKNKILTELAWKAFQDMFAENGMTIYESRGVVELPVVELTEAQREARRLQDEMEEFAERQRDAFFRVLERGDNAETARFLNHMRASADSYINRNYREFV